MQADQLQYNNLQNIISSFSGKGRAESRTFLNWFLESIFRLDPITADDSICDKENDRGIDGIYFDDVQNTIFILQGKIKQKEATIGDAPLRELAGTLTQFESAEAVQKLIDGGGNDDLKLLLNRLKVKDLVAAGAKSVGVFVTNQPLDANGAEFLNSHRRIVVYDRNKIASEFIEIEAEGGVEGEFHFDASYIQPMVIKSGDVTSYILPVKASELVKMGGIEDGTLFAQNVRLSLGSTKVNKSLRENVENSDQHKYFPLYHNGVTIICRNATFEKDFLKIEDYVVVNGAQSISTFKSSEKRLTEELRVLAKVIELTDKQLSRDITINSNNQNAIKPRDLKSTNELQIRLKSEFENSYSDKYSYEIKRGQPQKDGTELITNEEAGRLLLAFDLQEPESCHQVYKLFDEKYSEIFGRPAATAHRIVFLFEIMKLITAAAEKIDYKPLAKYGLTRFFLLSTVRQLLELDADAKKAITNPHRILTSPKRNAFFGALSEALGSLIIDLNYEVKNRAATFDYKGDLKSPVKIRELRDELVKSYEKEVAKGKVSPIGASLKD